MVSTMLVCGMVSAYISVEMRLTGSGVTPQKRNIENITIIATKAQGPKRK
jgi:hypothetical protein